MNILILHPEPNGYLRTFASILARDPRNKVIVGAKKPNSNLTGHTTVSSPDSSQSGGGYHFLKFLEKGILDKATLTTVIQNLNRLNFVPDIVYAHSGWGPNRFLRDIFPDSEIIFYVEWFYNAIGADVGFDANSTIPEDWKRRSRQMNASIMTDLYSCDRAAVATYWQWQQFPAEFHNKIEVIPDGIDIRFYQRNPQAQLVIPSKNLDLRGMPEIVTYVSPGFETYRGFPQFMRALRILQEKRPSCHAVIVGTDDVLYSPPGEKASKKLRDLLIEELSLDSSRIHFTGYLNAAEYRNVLQASSAHVYLTYPFKLSHSLLEAMAMECPIIASNTAPVTEIIRDGVSGLLADFFSPEEIAERIDEVLGNPGYVQEIKSMARKIIVKNFSLAPVFTRKIQHLFAPIRDITYGRPFPWPDGTIEKTIQSIKTFREKNTTEEMN